MKRCILILLFTQAAGEVTITGRIIDSVTHQPVAGASVEICCPDTTVKAAEDGTYTLHLSPEGGKPGRMFISRSGYANGMPPPKYLGGDFELIPAATISGRLVDRDAGIPIQGLIVAAQPQGTMASRLGTQPSDADGSFTITRLDPGDYILKVTAPTRGTIAFGERTAEDRETALSYGATWFPGVPRAEMAALVRVSAGEKREVEIKLQKTERRHISGAFQAPEGNGDSISISLAPKDRPMQPVVEGSIPKAGPFRIDGLDEGSYEMIAWSKGVVQPKLVAVAAFELTDRNIEGLKLAMRSPVSIRAVATMAEEKADLPPGVSLFMVPVIRGFVMEHANRMSADGLPPGQYWAELSLPPGYAVVSLSYNGHPVAHATIDVESSGPELNFVVTSRTASVSGFVRDENQNPVPEATVVVLSDPVPEALSGFSQGRERTMSSANGSFRLGSLAPGRYRVMALAGNDRQRSRDLDFLRDRMQAADPIVLGFGQSANLDLHIK